MNQCRQDGSLLISQAHSELKPSLRSAIKIMRFKSAQPGVLRSESQSITWWFVSAMVCGASLVWMTASPADHANLPDVFPVRPVLGGIGLCIAAGFAMMGLLSWSHRRDPDRRKESNLFSAYDSVTGLPTRRLYLVLLGQALKRAHVTKRKVAAMICVTEQFRPLCTASTFPNMTLVVRVQAARIKSALQSHDVVARLADHTFAVIADNLESPDEARSIAEKIQHAIALPLLIEGQELLVSCRIGGIVGPQKETDAEYLLDAASRILSDSQTADASVTLLSDPPTSFFSPSSHAATGRMRPYADTRH